MSPVTLDEPELQFMSRLLLDSPLLLANGKADSDPNGFLENRGLRDAMAVVLRGENNMVGTMLIANRLGEVTGFDDEDLRLLEMLANQTGVILERGRLQHSLSQLTVLQEQLRHEASHDPLTGMANRLLFGSRVDQALAQAGQHVGVLFIDIDDFKTVNDSLGHAAGDELLRAIADRIGQCLRPGDVAARLGGDEFAVLLIGIDAPATAVRIAERVIESLREPFIIAAEEVLTHASIGIATAIDTVRDGQELLQNADLALYTAKSYGKSRYAPPPAEGRPVPRGGVSRVRAGISADRARVELFHRGCGGVAALATPHARDGSPGRLHQPGGGDGTHHAGW
jgi:diguanylate cyclase (GGDEF)-like protein